MDFCDKKLENLAFFETKYRQIVNIKQQIIAFCEKYSQIRSKNK